MPISKNGKAYYTKEQYEIARYDSSALEYAQAQGYSLIRQGSYYTMAEHDSMIFTPRGNWFWNSRHVSGGALEFMIYYEGKTLTEAVLTLAGERQQEYARPAERPQPKAAFPPKPMPENAAGFQLPERAVNFKRMYGYLCQARKLDISVVKEMINQGILYQSDFRSREGKTISNATFVYQDPSGKPVGAFQRGMVQSGNPYKRDVSGSSKQYGWLLRSPLTPATEVRVFEGAIDAASDASLEKRAGRDWKQAPVDRLSLEGLGTAPLTNYLEVHPGVRHVTLMLDGDQPGQDATERIRRDLESQGYSVSVRVPEIGKDWNEQLVALEEEAAPELSAPEMSEP